MSTVQNLLRQEHALKASLAAFDEAVGERAMTDDEKAEFDKIETDIKATQERRERAERAEAARLATAKPLEPTAGIEMGHDRAEDRPWAPEGQHAKAFAAQMTAIQRASLDGPGSWDPRLRKQYAAASGSSEGSGADGGFALDAPTKSYIEKMMFESAELFQRTFPVRVGEGANSATLMLTDETSRAAGSRFGGIQVYHAAEADTVTAKKPKLREQTVKLEKIMGIWYATDELLADSSFMASFGPMGFAEEIAFQRDEDIFRGDGAGKAQGFMNSGALVTVAKETGQEAASLYVENINKMWSRMPARSKRNAIWLVNADVMPALEELTHGNGVSASPVFLPNGSMAGAPLATLKGRPIVENEHSATLGSLGDIALVDLSWYASVFKDESITGESSIHVRFLYGESTFRFWYRYNGLSMLNSAITPAQGSNTLSPFVTLAARS